MTEMYEDNFLRGFGPDEYNDLVKMQKELEDHSSWDMFEGTLSVEPVPLPIDARDLILRGATRTPQEVFEDTYDNTQLVLVHGGDKSCIRDCAIPSLIGTSGWKGSAVSRTAPEKLAIVFTIGLETARKKSNLLMRAGKVSAILSEQYEPLPISELLDICEDLELTFGAADFVSGSVTHSMTFAQWEFPDAAEDITKAYNKVLTAAGRPCSELMIPVVQFQSSDTSEGSAKLVTYLKLEKNGMFPIGAAAVEHTRMRSGKKRIDQFKEEVNLLFSKMEFEIGELIPKMLATPIRHPANVFISLCQHARIPQKWGGVIEEELRLDWPDNSGCTFLDIYEALTRCTSLAVEEDGNKPYTPRVLELEESISRIARNQTRWTVYDLPGTVAWNPEKVDAV